MRHFEKSLVIKGSSDPKRYLWQRFKLMFKLSEEQNNAIICKALKWLYNHLEILKIKYIFGYGMGGGGELGCASPLHLVQYGPMRLRHGSFEISRIWSRFHFHYFKYF